MDEATVIVVRLLLIPAGGFILLWMLSTMNANIHHTNKLLKRLIELNAAMAKIPPEIPPKEHSLITLLVAVILLGVGLIFLLSKMQ